ncbi:cytochrome P450 52A12 [Massarina eburnea CBS 473.64]|uniref:Cytochrome P450 52A12 n=1 Tax=Massarina eburnea CBS 473.64 TaxID=1395130 RepID=A0A6A6S229_9PLEO|nr:cytochrome P450 52A12 [Massarina eburnea CBS 473.64]
MYTSALLALWGGVAFVIYRIVEYGLEELRHHRNAKCLGCEPVYKMPNPDGMGITLLFQLLNSNRQFNFPETSKKRLFRQWEKEGRAIPTVGHTVFGLKVIHTVDPKNVQAVLATKFKDFGLGELRYKIFNPLLGDSIFSSDGETWSRLRALLRPHFARDQVSDLDLEERHVQHLMRHLTTAPEGWTRVTDLKPLFFRLTIDSATEFLFGKSADSQLSSLPGYEPSRDTPDVNEKDFTASFDAAQQVTGRSGLLGNLYWLMHNKGFKEDVRRCQSFIDHYVQLALNKEKSTARLTSTGKQKTVLLDGLIESTRDPIELRDHMMGLLLAGRDTTASLLSFVFMTFTQRPDVYAKLRTIVLETFGTYNHPRNITFESLKGCTYLQWVLNETLRLYPVLPIDGRRALKDTCLPFGGGPDGTKPVYIRKDTPVEYGIYTIHRRKDLWGEDADDFRPERWDGRRSRWEYIPFNGGPRICIGQQFALTEAAYVIVRLLQRFEKCEGVGNSWEPAEKGGYGYIRWVISLTGSPADGVKLRFKEAQESADE